MLNRIEGVPESSSLSKQGGETVKQPKKENSKSVVKPPMNPKTKNEPKDNATSGSKGKEKVFDERVIDDSVEKEPDEHELKSRKAHEAHIDEHNRIVREVEEKEKFE
ncbi:unnamed protein product [Lactuca saligna]|uniref:Uncharacterized protein n=1 Tax=Lactuca saligna TaxID=75948 RepID=A0AA35ZX01_LACSI|nr:unnamed protein product [Lactuca saligna]